MRCPKCFAETEMGYGLAGGGGIGPYVYCPQCDYFEKYRDPEMEDAREISEDARQVRKEDVTPGSKDQGG
jgi:hypothetical protein